MTIRRLVLWLLLVFFAVMAAMRASDGAWWHAGVDFCAAAIAVLKLWRDAVADAAP